MKAQTLEYREGEKLLKGFFACGSTTVEPRPGILVFHENTGLTDHEKDRAVRLAELGYAVLACDLFGERAVLTTDAERRAAFEEFRNKKLLPRAVAGLEA